MNINRKSIRSQNGNATKYAYKSFLWSLIVFILLIVMGLLRYFNLNQGYIEVVLSVIFFISSISGIGFSLISILKQQQKSKWDRIAIGGNILFFLFVIYLIIGLIGDFRTIF